MKVRIGREELLTGLQRVQGVVEKRNTMPILSNILLEAKHDGAEIVATDLEIGMRGLYKATVLEAGGVTISARKLYEIIKELPNGDIELRSPCTSAGNLPTPHFLKSVDNSAARTIRLSFTPAGRSPRPKKPTVPCTVRWKV